MHTFSNEFKNKINYFQNFLCMENVVLIFVLNKPSQPRYQILVYFNAFFFFLTTIEALVQTIW